MLASVVDTSKHRHLPARNLAQALCAANFKRALSMLKVTYPPPSRHQLDQTTTFLRAMGLPTAEVWKQTIRKRGMRSKVRGITQLP
ncbi:Os06g0590050 [Oryza sativa Japonica Group]|uniref:Os06g0590050 protein n=1 Tax=Oryza sativa subsp. japonica TaxID=39947 RepID=A0A0N7KMC3_ORYSJ|nr:Os06g0590050 [Oryza sativa Japonica Group]